MDGIERLGINAAMMADARLLRDTERVWILNPMVNRMVKEVLLH